VRTGVPDLGLNRRNLPTGKLLVHAAFRAAALALLWLALTGGDLGTWWLGALAVAAATLASLVLLPPATRFWSPLGTILFIGFFLRQSLVAGVDVARRSFSRGPDLDPAFIEYKLRLPDAAARVFFSNTISLLPGTLGTELRGRELRVHTLAVKEDLREELRYTEEMIARMFAVELSPDDARKEPGG
jgi:multicomponent Na+:H+ antiporter subunit E